MKRLILSVFIVVIFSCPCLASIDTTDSTINNTLWAILPYGSYFGFSGGIVYNCSKDFGSCEPIPNSSYYDLLLLSIMHIPIEKEEYPGCIFGSLSSVLGMGIMIVHNYHLGYFLSAILLKVNNNWTPPSN